MKNSSLKLRHFIQLASTIVINGDIYSWVKAPFLYLGNLKAMVLPILNCYACPGTIASCPAGSAQHFVLIRAIPFYLLGVLGIFGAAVGRFFCGWVCPFGFLQDLLAKVPFKKFAMPRFFRYFKYVFLAVTVLLLPYLLEETIFCKLCPDGILIGGIPQVLLQPELRRLLGSLFTMKAIILGAVLLLSLSMKRFFCRAICPVGAFMGFFNGISVLQMKVSKSACTSCNLCKKVCPVDIAIHENPASPECIRCGNCRTCPKGAVTFGTIFSDAEKEELPTA